MCIWTEMLFCVRKTNRQNIQGPRQIVDINKWLWKHHMVCFFKYQNKADLCFTTPKFSVAVFNFNPVEMTAVWDQWTTHGSYLFIYVGSHQNQVHKVSAVPNEWVLLRKTPKLRMRLACLGVVIDSSLEYNFWLGFVSWFSKEQGYTGNEDWHVKTWDCKTSNPRHVPSIFSS